MRRIAASPLHDYAFEPGEFFVCEARYTLFNFVNKTLDSLSRSMFCGIEIASFKAFSSAHIITVVCSGVGGRGP